MIAYVNDTYTTSLNKAKHIQAKHIHTLIKRARKPINEIEQNEVHNIHM